MIVTSFAHIYNMTEHQDLPHFTERLTDPIAEIVLNGSINKHKKIIQNSLSYLKTEASGFPQYIERNYNQSDFNNIYCAINPGFSELFAPNGDLITKIYIRLLLGFRISDFTTTTKPSKSDVRLLNKHLTELISNDNTQTLSATMLMNKAIDDIKSNLLASKRDAAKLAR